jgi:hypothetical protein
MDQMTEAPLCDTCAAMDRQDALQIKTLEIVQTIHNPCAPVTHFACKCRTCGTFWLALEVYDEDNVRPSEWSWERSTESPAL